MLDHSDKDSSLSGVHFQIHFRLINVGADCYGKEFQVWARGGRAAGCRGQS